MKVVSCRPAWIKTSNRFTNLFAQAVQDSGWNVREFNWGPSGLFSPSVILLHWPDELFTATNPFAHAKAAGKLAALQVAKQLYGTRLVWVVHETRPHDRGRHALWSTQAFLKSLDGAIYLSHASKRAGEADIPELKHVPSLVTRHGHYRFDMQRPHIPRRPPGKKLDLVYFGQIRPYKNLDGLINAARNLSPEDVSIKILGWCKDREFTRQLQDLAANVPAIQLDIRDVFVPQPDLEAALDESDGVVLPYRNILNSGAALFALSRNRPVMAPRLGTLPELQDEIGNEWVDLYDEDITEQDLRAFMTRLRHPQQSVADLAQYEWAPIGDSIAKFFDQISLKKKTSRSEQFQSDEARL